MHNVGDMQSFKQANSQQRSHPYMNGALFTIRVPISETTRQ
jgi:hypothetical protein